METNTKVTVKIFLGIKVTPDLKNHLEMSHTWNQDRLTAHHEPLIIPYQNKNYFGSYLTTYPSTIKEIEMKQKWLREIFKKYCPDFDSSILPIKIFPQIFIT